MDNNLNFYIVEDKLHSACCALRDGLIVAHATETVYGLAVDPWQPVAVENLLRMKGRDACKGLVLLVPNRQVLPSLTREVSPLARQLIDLFWPGPLTILFPARKAIPVSVSGGGDWVAVRHSSSPLVQALMQRWDKPLISTSANRSGAPPLTTSAEIEKLWGRELACILPGQIALNALPSTIIRVEGDRWQIVRDGAISRAAIGAALSAAKEPLSCRPCHFTNGS
ncbi:MAG: threonylcarbamoyl-AMP synthase [Magnetococcales bacterium]|nr:threonylcarbamoyl-AMP synthase [Magnetococcales bacterium]MBF0114813.1 threonylcarbamoyl-AMP synthase [Magnetococcales bacterium]